MGAFESGKASGVTAGDLVSAPDIGKVAPGKTNTVQTFELGEQFIDHGALCDGKDQNTAGCFLRDDQRKRLIDKFESRVLVAQSNYQHALAELRVDELMKKDDDLHWVLSLALDVAGAHILGVAARALKGVKAGGLAKLTEAGLDAARRGEVSDRSWSSRAEMLLSAVTDKRIDAYTKAGFDAGKKKLSKGVQSALNADDATDKASSLSFIVQLQNSCDIGFMAFTERATGSATDAELVVLWEGMHPSNHTQEAYKAELQEKLGRFKQSGVTDIGRKLSHDRTTGYTSVRRDTRVIWVMNRPGTGKTPYYQSQEGAHDPSVVKPGDPGSAWAFPEHAATSHEFGPANPRETPQLGRRVPEEFLEAAIARSEQLWGPTETIDARDYLVSQGYDPDVTSGALQPAPAADPANNRTMHAIFFGDDDAPPTPQPTPPQPAPLPKGSVFNKTSGGFPTDSVFAQQDQR